MAWSYDMAEHAQKCVERYCELANQKTKTSSIRVVSPHFDDRTVKNLF